MKKTDRTTISIAIETKMELERRAIDVSHKIGRQIKWTDIVHYMINNYQVMAKDDLIEEEKKTQ
tara:strand:- start:503 stop:694 length:192 start_codon:yes stop_codon:yes gene_type:complete